MRPADMDLAPLAEPDVLDWPRYGLTDRHIESTGRLAMDHTRPDELIIGVDPAEGWDETVVQANGGCSECHREWPSVTFKKAAGAIFAGEGAAVPGEMLCDHCYGVDHSLDKAIAEATTGVVPGLIRSVEVTGIESKTNVVSFKYATHIGEKELVTTLLNVAFKTKVPGEFVWYTFRNVPTVICEGWLGAPAHGQSLGGYFISFIKNSYDVEKKP